MNYRGIIATILAASIGGSFVIGVSSLAYWHQPLGEKGAEVLVAMGGAMASIIGVYIGSNIPK